MKPVTIQLRRYQVVDGRMDDFLNWFPQMRAVRESVGFRVLWTYVVPSTNEFVWAIAHDGDQDEFERTVERFRELPERAEALSVGARDWLSAMHEHFVDEAFVTTG